MNGDEFRIERGNSPEDIFWDTNENKDKWEVGGDYSRSLGTIGNLKALFVVNQQKEDKIVDRFIGAGAAQFENTQDSEFENKREKILLLTLKVKLNKLLIIKTSLNDQ